MLIDFKIFKDKDAVFGITKNNYVYNAEIFGFLSKENASQLRIVNVMISLTDLVWCAKRDINQLACLKIKIKPKISRQFREYGVQFVFWYNNLKVKTLNDSFTID